MLSLSSICSHCCTLHTVTPVMVMILQRAVSLRAVLQCLRPHCTFSRAATLRLSTVRPCREVLPGTSWHPGLTPRKLHTGADGSKTSSTGVPARLPFSTVTEEDVAFFRKTLPGRTITDPDLLESCNVDWLKSARGKLKKTPAKNSGPFLKSDVLLVHLCRPGSSEVLLRPQTTEEVSQILR